jgi:hypothetical protein
MLRSTGRATRRHAHVTSRAHYPSLTLVGALGALILAGVIVALQVPGIGWTVRYGDGWNYLAAGERLNVGHPLYELSPGDRHVLIVPPYWTVPLLAPPVIAVAWRPLASLGEGAMVLWGAAAALTLIASCVEIIRRGGILPVALLSLPLALVALSGNFSAFVVGLLLLVWLRRDSPWVCGLAVALAAIVKLTPLVLLAWLLLTGRARAVIAAGCWAVAMLVITLPFAGRESWQAWLTAAPSASPSPLAIATWTGIPPLVVAALLCIPVLIARRSERLGFTLAVVAASLATPALYFTAIAQLVVAPVPWLRSKGAGTGTIDWLRQRTGHRGLRRVD